MKIKQTLKPRMIALLSLLFLSVASTFAHTVTINVDTGGQWSYRIYSYSSGSWSSWSSNSSAPQTIPVEDGDRLSLQASSTDSDTYYYVGWFEGDTRRATGLSYTVTITSDRTFRAKFTTEFRTINLQVNNADHGKITASGPFANTIQNITTSTNVKVGLGAQLTVQGIANAPADEHFFLNWNEGEEVVSDDPSYSFDVTEDRTLTAMFTDEFWTITIAPNPADGTNRVAINGCLSSGWKTGLTPIKVAKGGKVRLANSAGTGYTMLRWRKVDGTDETVVYSGSGNYEFVAEADGTYYADFGKPYANTFTENTTLYVYTADEPNGDDTYKFYLLDQNEDPTSAEYSALIEGLTPYEYLNGCVIDGGGNLLPEGSGIHVTLVFNTSQPVGIIGYFQVIDGFLEVYLGDYYTNTTGITLKKTGGWNNSLAYSMFHVYRISNSANPELYFDYDNVEKSLDAQKIVVRGKDSDSSTEFDPTRQFVIDGSCVPTVVDETDPYTDEATYTISYGNAAYINNANCFRAGCGTLSMTNVTVQNFCTSANGIVSATFSNKINCKSSIKVDMEHCLLDHCVGQYPGVYINYSIHGYTGTSTRPTVTLKNSTISDCYARNTTNPEAAVRAISGSLCDLVMENCTVRDNYGNGVRWQSTNACTSWFTNCTIKGNKAFGVPTPSNRSFGCGGGMLIKSRAYISGCLIEDNWAQRSGGGIYFSTFEEGLSPGTRHYPEHGVLSLDEETIIRNNTAEGDGGGIAMMSFLIARNPYYGYTDGVQDGQYTMTLSLNGATVESNTAKGDGGGVYVSRDENATFYKQTCNLNYGTIKDNTATGNGGGVAIVGTSTYIIGDTIPSTIDPQDIDVIIGVAGEASKTMLIEDNESANGAGVYVEAYPITYTEPGTSDVTATVNTTVYDYTQINQNAATTDGGGLYLEKGDVSILQVGSKSPAFTKNTATGGSGGGLYLNEGSILLKGATIGGSSGNGNVAGRSGGGAYTNAGNILINPDEDEGIATTISHNTASANGGGVCTNRGVVEVLGNRSTGANVQITDNTASNGSGGGIFCMGEPGNTGVIVRLRRVNLNGNKALSGDGSIVDGVTTGCGGGLYLQQGLIGISYSGIGSNVANINGGGINNHSGSIFLMQSTVSGNRTTTGSGGGIYTVHGDILVNQQEDGTSFEEAEATQITNNTAYLNGGGLNTHSGYIKMHGTDDATRIQVTGNKALHGSGGGIFCMGDGSSTTEYINIMHADIANNETPNGDGSKAGEVATGCGGGMYLQEGVISITDVNLQGNIAKVNGGGINNHSGSINVRGCRIGGSSTTGNSAEGNGGGVYTVHGDIDIEDYTVTVGGFKRYHSKVTHNTAGGNGGGLNTHSGTITINNDQDDDEIEVTHNTAGYGGGMYAYQGTIVSHNALINSNTATSGNGGGINNHSGDIFIYGGQLSNNTAPQGNGGGAYTNAGDIDILYFPFSDSYADTLHGTIIYNNLARYNGGGINNHTGRVDVRYATLRNNTATLGNGGGIYCNGPHASSTGKTIRLLRTIIEGNKTHGADGTQSDPTGRGGGIYLKYGSIFAQGSLIRNNTANINGGGLDNHDGDIRVFGCTIDGNTATNGRGGGIYTQTGNITTGPCSLHRASQIINNTAKVNGGGINNHEGDILLNGDLISGNTAATGNGGGVYIANGVINMYGGRIAGNAAPEGKGGGVYSGGGAYNIQERQKLPVVEIIDAIPGPTTGDAPSDTIHYHLIFSEDANTTHEHGFKYGKAGSTTATTVIVSDANLDPDCYKPHLTGLDQATEYWVVAYATNANGTAVSDTAWFTTLSATLPTVFTGSHASVTAGTAEINGKVFDKGSSDIIDCGIQYSTDQSTWTSVPNGDLSATFITVTATELSANTTYYYRAYAINGSGPAYGETGSLKTAKVTPNIGGNMVDVSAIGSNTATFTFTIPAQSGVQCCGFVWSTDDDPELTEDHSVQCTVPASLATADGTITATPTNLDPATTYYVRAYVSFEAYDHGTDPTNYTLSTPRQFVTHNTGGLPTVHSVAASETTQHSLVAAGQVIYGGGSAVSARGFRYSTDGSTDPSTWTQASSAGETEEFEVAISGLAAGTTYHLCAYATNTAGTVYGNRITVTTLPVTIPEVVIFSIDTEVSGTAGATITCTVLDGGATIGTYGVTYSPNSDMSGATTTYGTNLSGGTFSVALSGLAKNATYYVQAFANNTVGGHTTHKVSFTTPYDPFTIVLSSIDPVGSNTATANATVTPASDNIKTYGVCWSTHSPAKRTTTAAIDQNYYDVYFNATGVNTTTNYSHAFAPTYPNTRYYARAYASVENSGSNTGGSLGTLDYSDEVAFLTLPAMATGAADNVTKSTATLTGTIASTDPHHYLLEYGFCWSTSANPTIADSHLSETIAAANSSMHSFSMNVTELVPSRTYHYRAYCKNSEGKYAYGEDRTFTTKAFDLTTSSTPAAGGSASPAIAGMDTDDILYVTATAKAGYTFDPATGWTVTGEGAAITAANPTKFTMGTEDAHLTATFTPNTYTLTVEANMAEGGSVSGGGSVAYGSSVTITATANEGEGYTFVNWTLNGDVVSTQATYTFYYNVAGSATYVANFIVGSKGSTTMNATPAPRPRPRDIYPAPAREPWDWDDEDGICFAKDTIAKGGDNRANVEPENIPIIDHNSAKYGGGVFVDYTDETLNADSTKLVFSGSNSSSNRGKIVFNTATEAGGGIYINNRAHMQMSGHCEVNANTVPAGKDGGGIYLKGRLYVGKSGTSATDNGLVVNRNFSMNGFSETQYNTDPAGYASSNKAYYNNVCLTRHTYDFGHASAYGTYDHESTVITLLSDISGFSYTDSNGNGTYDPGETSTTSAASSIGFHVTEGFCPVIATSDGFGNPYMLTWKGNGTSGSPYASDNNAEYEQWLQNIMWSSVGTEGLMNGSGGAIFEDTESYVAIHTRQPSSPFNSKYIYLWGCWTHPAVNTDPEDLNPMTTNTSTAENFRGHYKIIDKTGGILTWEIYSEEGLSWFSSYVNGLNAFEDGDGGVHAAYDPDINPYAKAVLMRDLDLSAHFWVPIGSVTSFNKTDVISGLSGGSLFTDDPADPHHFKGTFDGQGHVIKGIDSRYLSGIYKLGLFGYLDGEADVRNVFVDGSRFESTADHPYHIGGIAGKMEGTARLSASEARADIDVSTITTAAYKADSYVGGLIGEVASTGSAIHSSMAMPEVTGTVDHIGGLVGKLGTGNALYNSFANPKFNNDPATGKHIGGLVGVNSGTVENCYSRLRGTEPAQRFGYLAGTNGGSINFSYIPAEKDNYVSTGSDPAGHGTYSPTVLVNGKYGFKHRDQQMAKAGETAAYISETYNDTIVGGLQRALNAWVDDHSGDGYAQWSRTMASPINGDYPVLLIEDFNSVGSRDGIFMEYEDDINDMWTGDNGKHFDWLNATDNPNAAMYLYNANTEPVAISGNTAARLYIHEDVGITQTDGAQLHARVGVFFDNSDCSLDLGGKDYDWHMFSSALQAAPMGLDYYSDNSSNYSVEYNYGENHSLSPDYPSGHSLSTGGILDSDYSNPSFMDPPRTTWSTSDIGYFPTDTPYGSSAYSGTAGGASDNSGSFDFYCFDERNRHWINFKRRGEDGYYDHWHQDAVQDPSGAWLHHKIEYDNERTMQVGKGYMMGVSKASMLMADGVLNNTGSSGELNSGQNLSNSYYDNLAIYSESLRGTNLVGNPFQSYLDFDELCLANPGVIHGNSYYLFDADAKRYIIYPVEASSNPVYAPRFIHPHQGFFVMVDSYHDGANLRFTGDMRLAEGNEHSTFRDNRLDYPLVNLFCYDESGRYDVTTVEINRPRTGGGIKMTGLRTGNMLIYARQDDKDYQTAFTPVGTSTVPVRFQAFEDGLYTLKWQTLHGDFSHLHLIDNLTGADVDCLTHSEYRFEGKTSDYLSRFKLVFECTGVEEESADGEAVDFAFQMGDELVVNGEGSLLLFDLSGRCLLSAQTAGAQSLISLPDVAPGVYFLRLSGDRQMKTQKMVIRK